MICHQVAPPVNCCQTSYIRARMLRAHFFMMCIFWKADDFPPIFQNFCIIQSMCSSLCRQFNDTAILLQITITDISNTTHRTVFMEVVPTILGAIHFIRMYDMAWHISHKVQRDPRTISELLQCLRWDSTGRWILFQLYLSVLVLASERRFGLLRTPLPKYKDIQPFHIGPLHW